MKNSNKIANGIIITLLIYCLAAFLFIVVLFHSSTLTKIIYATPIALLPLLFWVNQKRKCDISIMLFSLFAGLFIANLGMWRIWIMNNTLPPATEEGLPTDRRSALEVLNDLRAHGEKTFPFFRPGVEITRKLSPVPVIDGKEMMILGSVANREILFCNESGKWLLTMTDKYGFHNNNGIYDRPIRTAAVGDSYVFGECVKEDENFVSRLEQMGISGIANFGIGGIGPLMQLAILMEYISPYKPAYVLWFYNEGNDFLDLQNERKFPGMTNYLYRENYSNQLMKRQKQIDAWIEKETERRHAEKQKGFDSRVLTNLLMLWDLKRYIKTVIQSARGEFRLYEDLKQPDMVLLYAEILKKADRLVSGWKGHFIFIYNPDTYNRVHHPAYEGFPQRKKVLEMMESLNIPIIDLTPKLITEHPDPLSLLPFHKLGHYNKKGYQIIAEEIKNRLIEMFGRKAVLNKP